jgi:ABC-type proline/glycine betaine transport system substrate-binding protein
MLKKLFILVAFQLSLLSYTSASYAITIKIGHNDTSYDQAAVALFKVVFERSGYNVAETQGDPDLLLSMLDRGEIRLLFICMAA